MYISNSKTRAAVRFFPSVDSNPKILRGKSGFSHLSVATLLYRLNARYMMNPFAL